MRFAKFIWEQLLRMENSMTSSGIRLIRIRPRPTARRSLRGTSLLLSTTRKIRWDSIFLHQPLHARSARHHTACADLRYARGFRRPAPLRQSWRVSANVPMYISELNISWNTGESFVDTFGALWLADFAGAFFAASGDGLYYFHYPPMGVHQGCGSSIGTFGMFTANSNYQIQQYTSQYFASQLITQEWVQPGNGAHQVFPAASDVHDPAGHILVTAYAVHRPDGQWALMIVNKDQENSHAVQISFGDGATGSEKAFSGTVDVITFGSEQYQWHPTVTGGSADPDGPAARSRMTAAANTTFTLPKASITVLQGKIAAAGVAPAKSK